MKTLLTRPHNKGIRDAYDIQKARKACKGKGFQSQIAYACMKGGFVHLFPFKTPPKSANDLQTEVALCRRWLAESDFKDLFLSKASFPKTSISPRIVRCVAYSDGSGWRTFDEDEVCRRLCNPRMREGKGWYFAPINGSVIDPALSDFAWHVQSKVPVADRSFAFAQGVLLNAALLHIQAEQSVEGFLEAYKNLDLAEFWSSASLLATLIRDVKNAALRHMDACLSLVLPDIPRPQDEAIASQQGFLMGRWLAQAEAMIANERPARLAAVLGEGKKQTKFWGWINSDPYFAGKTAKEVWPLLEGSKDPDHPSFNLKIEAGVLVRGNGVRLTETSFRAKFRRH